MVVFWFIRTFKAILFWLYLWQLKEYHTGRFLDHFRTEKGKEIFFGKLFLLKVILVFIFLLTDYLLFVFFALFLVYIGEAVKAIFDFISRRLKRPVLTKKTLLLVFVCLLVEAGFAQASLIYSEDVLANASWLLLFDILLPLIVSLIVLLFQPLTVFFRSRIIKQAKAKRGEFEDLLVIGITGSYGKTSTKEFLTEILSEKYKVLKTKEHQNSEIGISQCILNELKREHKIFICEMGAYNVGGIKLLADIAKPKIGILTGINEQHMATFGSQEKIIEAKYELIESLPEDGLAFFNGKNEYCRQLYERTKIKKFLYGQEARSAGQENILGAEMVAREIGIDQEDIARVLERIKEKVPATSFKQGINGLRIIDASYSANPQSVIAHLDNIKNQPGKKIIIMPCLIELGKASKEVHLRIGKKVAQVCDLAIITTKDRFKEIREGAGEKVLFLGKPKEIMEKIKSFTKENDIILLEGGKSSGVQVQLIKLLNIR